MSPANVPGAAAALHRLARRLATAVWWATPGAAVGLVLPYAAAVAFWPNAPNEEVLGQMLAGAVTGSITGPLVVALHRRRRQP